MSWSVEYRKHRCNFRWNIILLESMNVLNRWHSVGISRRKWNGNNNFEFFSLYSEKQKYLKINLIIRLDEILCSMSHLHWNDTSISNNILSEMAKALRFSNSIILFENKSFFFTISQYGSKLQQLNEMSSFYLICALLTFIPKNI